MDRRLSRPHGEADAAANAIYCVFNTPGAAEKYRQRYPNAADRMVVLGNGYDEESFANLPEASPAVASVPGVGKPMVLLHSGIVYPSERDPTQLFAALQSLHRHGRLTPAELHIRFRASVHEGLLQGLATEYGVQDYIELCPAVPYREALAEMQAVDALLVMQASNCNAQIPAKIYEYLRAGRPIIALTDPVGDTAGVLRHAGLDAVVPLDSVEHIEAALPLFLEAVRSGRAELPEPEAVRGASRLARSQALVKLLNQVAQVP